MSMVTTNSHPLLFGEVGSAALPSDYIALMKPRVMRLVVFTALVGMLAAQGIGLALNLEVAPSAMLIPAEAGDWLSQTLSHGPNETEARLTEVSAPHVPEVVVTGLDRKLAIAGGLARFAYLAAAKYDDGAAGHVLVFIDAVPDAHQAMATAASEA